MPASPVVLNTPGDARQRSLPYPTGVELLGHTTLTRQEILSLLPELSDVRFLVPYTVDIDRAESSGVGSWIVTPEQAQQSEREQLERLKQLTRNVCQIVHGYLVLKGPKLQFDKDAGCKLHALPPAGVGIEVYVTLHQHTGGSCAFTTTTVDQSGNTLVGMSFSVATQVE